MALARITYTWPSGDTIELEVDSSDVASHPDLLDMLVCRVLTMYRETCTTGEG